MRSLLVLALLSCSSFAVADPPGTEPMTLEVGRSVPFRPGFLPAQVVCDDTSIVKVEDAGDHFVLTGVAPGKTLCGFSSIAPSGRRRVLSLTIRPRR